MKKVIKIDNSGLFIEDVLLYDNDFIPDNCIITPCPDGFYRPKWDGKQWIEDLTQDEIDEIKSSIPIPPPTLEDLASGLTEAMRAIMELSLE